MENQLSKHLAYRLAQVLLNGTWIAGTNWKNELNQTDFLSANTKCGNLNTIALLSFHLNYYLQGLCRVLQGNPLEISDRFSFDAPELNSEEDWETRKALFFSNARLFIELIEQATDDFILSNFVDPGYGTWQNNVEGFLEHAWYHLGQIVLIRKMIETTN
jgi:hypothetical protein